MSHTRIACVTGANKGIGLAIVRQLALQYPKSSLNNGPLLIYLTARDESRGQKALADLRNDQQLLQAKALRSHGGLTDLEFHPLDIAEEKSIHALRDLLKEKHPDGIDIVVNNAAVALDGFNSQIVRDTLRPNYYGTLSATKALLLIFRPEGGRLVNVSSSAGKLRSFSSTVSNRLSRAKTLDDVAGFLTDFHDGVEAGREKELGFKSAAYATSKAALNAATRIVAAEEKERGSAVLINCCDPGYVNTDMSKGRGIKTPDEGAQTPVHLAVGDIEDCTGLYWCNKKVEDF